MRHGADLYGGVGGAGGGSGQAAGRGLPCRTVFSSILILRSISVLFVYGFSLLSREQIFVKGFNFPVVRKHVEQGGGLGFCPPLFFTILVHYTSELCA